MLSPHQKECLTQLQRMLSDHEVCDSCKNVLAHVLEDPEPAMTRDELVEHMAKSAHDSWWGTYIELGYTSRKAAWGEEFMVPFEQLSEQGKEFDRMIMRAILKTFEAKGITLNFPAK
jgi:hypothetical protein